MSLEVFEFTVEGVDEFEVGPEIVVEVLLAEDCVDFLAGV